MKRAAFSPHDEVYIEHLKTTQKHNMAVQHYHDSYEVYLMLDGKRYLFCDNICYTMERGDLAIFTPFDIHYGESRDADYYERYVLNFKPESLACILNKEEQYLLLKKLEPCVLHLTEEQTKKAFDYFERVEEYSKQHGFLSGKLLYASVLQLILFMLRYTNDKTVEEGEKIAPQVVEALKYINENYKKDITLDEIAQAAHMSKYYFCRLFRSVTGATVLEYLNNIRLAKAHNLLIHTTYNMDEIAKETGFSSAVNLARVFKKSYGTSPREFRKKQKGSE